MEFRDSGVTFLSVPQLLQSAKPVVKADLESGVDVWGYLLDGDAQAIEQCGAWLTLEERTRASRFIRPEDQRRYIVGRGGLRKLLSGYTGLDPAAVIIQVGPEGKPALGNQDGGVLRVRFNLSHSHGRMLVGITSRRDVGVDLEQIALARLDGQPVDELAHEGRIHLLRPLILVVVQEDEVEVRAVAEFEPAELAIADDGDLLAGIVFGEEGASHAALGVVTAADAGDVPATFVGELRVGRGGRDHGNQGSRSHHHWR